VSIPEFDEARPLLLEYAKEYIAAYTETIDAHFSEAKTVIFAAGRAHEYFPLYGRQLGVDLAIASFYTQVDFYLFFLDEPGAEIKAVRSLIADSPGEFSLSWLSDTPDKRRIQRVKEYLGLESAKVLQPAPNYDAINMPGTNFISRDALNMRVAGHEHGVNFGDQAGERAESAIPKVQEVLQRSISQSIFSDRYRQLVVSGMSPQARGNEFEELWRNVLQLYGWKPKKFRIPGEENDFTAIYQGLHILGEVRWFDSPMDGNKMRAFLAKLDPRPQTIGLFISHSGFDRGALGVRRRSANSKTVIIFEKEDIEKVMLDSADPGPIFDEKLRDAYDFIFERTEES